MNCHDFWIQYDETGLTPDLEAHLRECPGCRREMEAERALMSSIRELPVYTAPDHVWDRIARKLPEENPDHWTVWGALDALSGKIRSYLAFGHPFSLKPVMIGMAIVIVSVLATRYYYTRQLFPGGGIFEQVESPRNLEDIEREYLSAIESLTLRVENSKESLDPELYDLYSEKLALLDEYIQQCSEALKENENNPNARYYLALAYKDKIDTLREMAGHM